MSKLQQILNLNTLEDFTHKTQITERLKDDNGEILKFTIKPISFNLFNQLKKRATSFDKKGNPVLNEEVLNSLIVIESTINPNFKDSKSLELLNCSTPSQYLNKVLLAGEIEKLLKKILTISGFDNDFDEIVQEVKN